MEVGDTAMPVSHEAIPASHRDINDEKPHASSEHIMGRDAAVKHRKTSDDESNSTESKEDMSQAYNTQTGYAVQLMQGSPQTSPPDPIDGASTPPTSTSDGFSSQGTNRDSQISQLSQLSQLAAVQEPLNAVSGPNISILPTVGLKRTADGELKSATSKSPVSPKFPVRGHVRNRSGVSNASSTSRIGELSSELRTRLSYAMVKVNHGWQSNSIEEVESLASQKGSPTSSSSTLQGRRNFISSPRATIASLQGQTSNVSTVSQISQTPSGDFDLYSRTEPSTRTYESFWADHSSASVPTNNRQLTSPPMKPGLAPSADIRPTATSRRSGTPKFAKPPQVPGHNSNSSLISVSPRTPHRSEYRDHKNLQTPTQKTLQEQDAIETLLFMSSPGNSGNMGHTFPPPRTAPSPQHSPLRTEFQARPPVKRVGFDDSTATASTTSSEAEYRHRQLNGLTDRPSKVQLRQKDAMDRMLDAMDSSSDEDDSLLAYTEARHYAASRI